MRSFLKRLQRLEEANRIAAERITRVVWQIIEPAPDGGALPFDPYIAYSTSNAEHEIQRRRNEDIAAFQARALSCLSGTSIVMCRRSPRNAVAIDKE